MIKCTNFRSYEKGNCLGFATLLFEEEGFEMGGFVLNQKDGKRWVSVPGSYKEINNEKKWVNVGKFPEKDKYVNFQNNARKAIDKFCQPDDAPSYADQIPSRAPEKFEDIPF